ncbi:fluoride efflux transporter CrcB [Pelosinus fermentans]|uniref:Fluoride-specific ion channel FluC n=1 Tax=Pelosinus fermentans JBW45 TaxID=1192197 RepID=I9DEE7_9FIRM|nr:fluoride efflux transporter CrcB [Pelosinus fermentans]AJQ28562.1 CrcB-like protein [Pelosinus fermentans JBW45]
MLRIIAVAVGGSIGATARYLVSVWAAERFGADFPYGTLIVNVVGCFIIGIFMTLTTERFIVNPYWRLLITVGFLGGLTTFSSFSYETFRVLENSNMIMALYNIGLNLLLGFVATWIGIGVARLV